MVYKLVYEKPKRKALKFNDKNKLKEQENRWKYISTDAKGET